jgi:hypothetical protein
MQKRKPGESNLEVSAIGLVSSMSALGFIASRQFISVSMFSRTVP